MHFASLFLLQLLENQQSEKILLHLKKKTWQILHYASRKDVNSK